MSPRQWIVLAVALIAAVGALLFVRAQGSRSAATAETPAQIETVQVLTAAKDVPLGTPLAQADLRWSEWPKASAPETFVRQDQTPDALESYIGAVTKFPLQTGEPLFPAKVAMREAGGAFAALLEPGRRAVAVPISAENAAAGFIAPGDRVDVILTRSAGGDRGGKNIFVSDVVLQNVRVLAVGSTTQPPKPQEGDSKGPAPIEGDVATLDVAQEEMWVLLSAIQSGRITLALRGYGPEPAIGTRAPPRAEPAPVKFHAFGTMRELGGDQ